jgi:hypothetical protein
MELVVRKNDLLRELQLFQGIVERKNTIPDPGQRADGSQRRRVDFLPPISRWAAQQMHGDGRQAGSLTLPAKKFYEIVKSLPNRHPHRRGQERREGRRRSLRLAMQTLPREDFPTLPESAGATATLPRTRSRRWSRRRSSRSPARTRVFSERRAVRAAPDR